MARPATAASLLAAVLGLDHMAFLEGVPLQGRIRSELVEVVQALLERATVRAAEGPLVAPAGPAVWRPQFE
jgi:hypothetical protein